MKDMIKVRDQITLLQGLDAQVAQYQEGMLLNINSCFRVLQSESILQKFSRLRHDKEACLEMVAGSTILTTYQKVRSYKVIDIDFDNDPSKTFTRFDKTTKKHEEMSLVDYYKKMYNVGNIDMRQPLLVCLSNGKQCKRVELLP